MRCLKLLNHNNSAKEMVDITRLPGYWLTQNKERLRLGIPCYRIANGDVIRFTIEEIFRREVHHLRPCRCDAGVDVDEIQFTNS